MFRAGKYFVVAEEEAFSKQQAADICFMVGEAEEHRARGNQKYLKNLSPLLSDRQVTSAKILVKLLLEPVVLVQAPFLLLAESFAVVRAQI